jgi:hypothetical protein
VLLGEPSTENILLLRQEDLLPLASLFNVDCNSPYYHEENKGSAQATLGAAKPPVSEEPHGPHHGVKGTIRDVQCSLPAIMELKVEGDDKTLSLHSNNYFRIQFIAANFTPEGELHPCTDLEGMKANVEFFEASGKPGEGQIFSIELRK